MKKKITKIFLATCIVIVLALLVGNIIYGTTFWNRFFGVGSNLMVLVVFALAWRALDRKKEDNEVS